MWCDVMWCDVTWRDVLWCDVVLCDVVWCEVMWCGVMWCDIKWCDVMWRDVMWCDVSECGKYVNILKYTNLCKSVVSKLGLKQMSNRHIAVSRLSFHPTEGTTRLFYIKTYIKIYTKVFLHVSVNKPSSGSLPLCFAKVMVIKIVS
jgi:hypothetical protein